VCIRDGDDADFCWREAVRSLLPICDSVTICDGGSTDGTLEAIQEWMKTEPKIRLVHYPWPNPKGMLHFWVTWLNWCREQIPHFWHLQLDADEVLFESSYEWIDGFTRTKREESARMTRLNFWKDHRHVLPHGHVCGHIVMRLAPQSLWMPTDYPHPLGERLCQVSCPSPAQIGHYGFIRKREGYFTKQRRYQGWVHDSYDPRCVKAESATNHLDSIASQCGWAHLIQDYKGPHPEAIKPWLRERGYAV
jgi:glycosyltransferase involved in cell wall biosynthesis